MDDLFGPDSDDDANDSFDSCSAERKSNGMSMSNNNASTDCGLNPTTTITTDPDFHNDAIFDSIMMSSNSIDDLDNHSDSTASLLRQLPIHQPHSHIPGLVLHTNIFTSRQESRLVHDMTSAKSDYFMGGQLNQAMRFGAQDMKWLDWAIEILKDTKCIQGQLESRATATTPIVEKRKDQLWVSRAPLFDQCILNLYRPGDGIKSHVDLARFQDGIVIISLLSAITMDFRPITAAAKVGFEQGAMSYVSSSSANDDEEQLVHSVRLEPGSVVTLQGPARYEWEHGIQEKTHDLVEEGDLVPRKLRISITLRSLCESAWEGGIDENDDDNDGVNGVADRGRIICCGECESCTCKVQSGFHKRLIDHA